MTKQKDYTLVLLALIIGITALFEYGCSRTNSKPAEITFNGYTMQVDGTDSILRYSIHDGNRFVGNVPATSLDSLINADNQ